MRKIQTKIAHRIVRVRGWVVFGAILLMLAAIPLSFLEKTNAAGGNLTWTAYPAAEANNWTSVAWSPELNLFAAVSNIGSMNRVMTSPDGMTWTSRTALGANDHWRSITWSPGVNLFVAVGSAGGVNKVMTSPDGITWTARTPSEAGDWVAVTWSPERNLFVAVGNGGSRVMTSPNGINWTSRTAAAANAWYGVTWSAERNLFVAVSINGTDRVMTSPDGITWTSRTTPEANEWRSVAWSPELNLFVAVATTGTSRVMTSPDGVTWTPRAVPEANPWGSVAWSPERGVFAAVAGAGTNRIMTSNDGINWTGQAAPEANGWVAVAWAPALNSFGAIANSGTNRTMVGAPATAAGPGGVAAGLYTWQRADDGTASGASWQDSSGNGRAAAQATAGSQPTFVANGINFNPALQFDGTDDSMSINSLNHNASIAGEEMLAAVLPSSGVGNGNIIGWGDLANTTDAMEVRYANSALQYGAGQPWTAIINPTTSDGYAQITNVHRFKNDSTPAKILLNGTEVASGTVSARPTDDRMNIGARRIQAADNQVFNGLMGDVIFYDRQLTPAERQRVSTYLGVKYGITLGHDYIDSGGTTIWNKTANATYSNDIAGIGRDDNGGLNQKQSKSVNTSSLVTVGHGDIAATNQANTNSFSTDRTFMVWGHDNANTDQTADVTGTSYKRMNRIWQTMVTNSPGAVKIQIPTSAITRSNAVLLTSSSATFDNTSQTTNMTVNGANYEATVTLASGTHYFTFGSPAGSDIEFVSKTATDISNASILAYTPGQPLEYHLIIQNNGPDDAGTVTVTDTLPVGIVPTSGGTSGDGWSCNVAGQTVTCTRTALASGDTAPEILIEATIASSVTGQKINTATASVADDPDMTNNSASVTLDATPEADLSIAKEDTTPGSPLAGTEYDYKFTVRNDGPSDVASYTITDTLPVGLTYVSSSPTTACPGSSGQNVSCTGGAIPAGQTSVIAIKVHVDTGGNYTNTATVGVPAGTTDPNPANNSSTNITNVNVETDLTVSKTHTGNFTAGDSNSFAINATNNGPSEAPAGSITVTDTLDEDFSFVSAIGTNWTCTHNNGTVTCTYNAALASTSTTGDITLTVMVDPIAKGATTNIATVSGTTPDPNLNNNSSTDNITIESEADLGITKTVVGNPLTPGTQGQFSFSVVNNGPSVDTPTYTITDTLPAEFSFVSSQGDATCVPDGGNPQLITCTGGGMGVGDPAQVTTIIVDIDSGASGSVDNTATVAPDPSVTDPTPGNNTSTATVNFEPNADLAISKIHTGDLTAGENEDYTLTVTNNGPTNVSSFTVTDTLPAGLTYVSASPNICGGSSGQNVSCTGGAIANGGNAVVTLTVMVDSNAVSGFNVANTANVAPPAGTNDPDTTNNSSTVNNTIAGSADLAITKSHTGNFKPATDGSFTIEVVNNGPSDVSTFTITDVLPSGFTYVSATGDATCNATDQTVTCYGAALSPTDTATLTLNVSVNPDVTASSIDNTASVTSPTPDPNTANNSSTDTVTIDTASADLAATKALQGSLMAGESATYRFEITNNGPDNAGAVTISDTLESYLSYESFTSVSGGIWNCSANGQDITCTLPVLNNGDTAVVDVAVLVAQDAPDTADNTGVVTFNGTDTSSNTPNTSDPISHEADLEVQLTHESKTYQSGDTVTYTYTVINHGPSRAENVVLTDTLPEGLTFDNIVAANQTQDSSLLAKVVDTVLGVETVNAAPNTPFNCSNSGQNVTCNASALGVGTYTITMTAQIASNFTGNLTSALQISSSTFDPNMANNSTTDTILDVTPSTGLAGTGQNLWTWLMAAVGVIAIPATGAVFMRKRMKV